MNFKKIITLLLCIILPLFIGAYSGFATAGNILSWYPLINKPWFNPPNYLFGPVWTTLYILMGISLYLILQTQKNKQQTLAIYVFCLQLGLNFWWSFLFFKHHLLGVAFLEIIAIWISILAMIFCFYKINKTAALINIPYLLWVSFASVLSGSIYYLN